MTTRKAQVRRRVEKNKRTTDAIITGIKRAEDAGYTKVYDVAICVKTELDKAGLKIVNKPETATDRALAAGSFAAAFE